MVNSLSITNQIIIWRAWIHSTKSQFSATLRFSGAKRLELWLDRVPAVKGEFQRSEQRQGQFQDPQVVPPLHSTSCLYDERHKCLHPTLIIRIFVGEMP